MSRSVREWNGGRGKRVRRVLKGRRGMALQHQSATYLFSVYAEGGNYWRWRDGDGERISWSPEARDLLARYHREAAKSVFEFMLACAQRSRVRWYWGCGQGYSMTPDESCLDVVPAYISLMLVALTSNELVWRC